MGWKCEDDCHCLPSLVQGLSGRGGRPNGTDKSAYRQNLLLARTSFMRTYRPLKAKGCSHLSSRMSFSESTQSLAARFSW